MSGRTLRERVEELEAQVARLQAARELEPPRWLAAMQRFSGNAGLLALLEEAQKLRDSDRQRARRKTGASRRPVR